MAEDLDLAAGVVEIDEHAAVADGADASRDCDLVLGLGARREPGIALLELFRHRGDGEAIGIGVDAHRAQRFELLDPREAERVFFVAFVSHQTALLETYVVTSAKAGVQSNIALYPWIPAFAGMTVEKTIESMSLSSLSTSLRPRAEGGDIALLVVEGGQGAAMTDANHGRVPGRVA